MSDLKVKSTGQVRLDSKKKNNQMRKNKTGYKISFTEILSNKEQDKQRDDLQEALNEIDRLGDKLVENRTVNALYEYKAMIKEIVEEVVDKGYSVVQKRGHYRGGRTKVLKTVSEIDSKLTELTKLVLTREEKELKILNKVGEIKGLLVDLML